ncbi:MAG: hypothetical protein ACE5IP_09055 [Terriglobia bacterium]
MSELLFFLALGLALLVLLLLWASRRARAVASREEVAGVQEALAALQLAGPPRTLEERIFACQDWDFVTNHTPRTIQRDFLNERRKLALSWLRETRKKVAEILALHRIAVRRRSSLRPAAELGLVLHYLFFIVVYATLFGLIWLRGPFAVRRMVSYAGDLAEQLSLSAALLLVELDRASLTLGRGEEEPDSGNP